ncbi:MAG TPA: RDD family protein [Pseudonocardiaceae bacterium]|jgi:uncharacterized RDD family membrane protein YckC|nr:RDD family protein [Pseudonocardiaceae bacterium]
MTQPHTGPADPTDVVLRRCIQFVLDILVVSIPVIVLGVVATTLFLPSSSLAALELFTIVLFVSLLVLFLIGVAITQVWWPHRHGGQTPAMRWLGLRMITLDGAVPLPRAYFVRWLMQIVDGFLWGVVGLIIMLTSERHQRLGDMVAGTLVVRAD